MKWLGRLPVLLAAVVAAVAVGFVAVNVLAGSRLPDGPVDVAWDREVCAHCRMHVGEPAFAVQLQAKDGRVLFFDDPGCAALWLGAAEVEVHAVYFRHHREERWIEAARAGFVPVAQSPMGFGFGAVDEGDEGVEGVEGVEGAIPWPEAAARMARRE